MHKALVINADKCTSCLQCEMACSFEKDGIFNPARSRIKIFEFEHGRVSVPYTCTQCSQAWCENACPVDALKRNNTTNAIELDANLCVGCKVCTIACPFGTINYDPTTKVVAKCDLCGGDPACAKACPTGAILFVEEGWTGLEKMKQAVISTTPSLNGEDAR